MVHTNDSSQVVHSDQCSSHTCGDKVAFVPAFISCISEVVTFRVCSLDPCGFPTWQGDAGGLRMRKNVVRCAWSRLIAYLCLPVRILRESLRIQVRD